MIGDPYKRIFGTGATRDVDHGKFDYEAFLSPLVLERYAEYMHQNRQMKDGSVRDGDNWQKGIPLSAFMKSLWRHFMDLWKNHRGLPTADHIEVVLCAILFNVSGYLHEVLKHRGSGINLLSDVQPAKLSFIDEPNRLRPSDVKFYCPPGGLIGVKSTVRETFGTCGPTTGEAIDHHQVFLGTLANMATPPAKKEKHDHGC